MKRGFISALLAISLLMQSAVPVWAESGEFFAEESETDEMAAESYEEDKEEALFVWAEEDTGTETSEDLFGDLFEEGDDFYRESDDSETYSDTGIENAAGQSIENDEDTLVESTAGELAENGTNAPVEMNLEDAPEDFPEDAPEDAQEDMPEETLGDTSEDTVETETEDIPEGDEDFWADLFEDEDLFEESLSSETEDEEDVEEGVEQADEAVALDDATVVPDVTLASVTGSSSKAMRLMGASGSIDLDETFLYASTYDGSFGNQLNGMAKEFYQKRVEYYANGKGTGSLEISYTKENSPIIFPADTYIALNEEGNKVRYLDRTTASYLEFHSLVQQAMQEAGDAFLYDHSEVFWVRGGTYSLSPGKYKDSDGSYIGYLSKIVYTPVASFDGAASLIEPFQSALAQKAAEIRSEADYDGNGQADQLELSLAIHDYLCQRLYYDNAALSAYDSYVSSTGSSKGYGDFRIFVCAGAFLDSVGNGAVCEGYARAYKVLCDYYGIPCVLIGGKVVQNGVMIGHMWNGIRINGKWYLCDATWDDSPGEASHRYFMVGNTLSGRTSSGNFSGSSHTRNFVYPELETVSLEYCENLRHDFELVSTSASCTKTGISNYVCTRCGLTLQVEEKLEHEYQAYIVLPTCVEEGYTEHICEYCQDTWADEYTDPLGHDYEKKVTKPTCLKDGYTDYTCKRCGDSYRSDAVKALGHSFANGSCTRCGVTDSIANANIAPVAKQTYTGSQVKPSVTVSFGSVVLKEGTDYTLKYENNISVGTAGITVTGKGNYKGTKKIAFRVARKKITGLTFSSIPAQVYSGKAKKPSVTIMFHSVKLVKGTDYTVTYSKNVEVGKAVAVITGIGNYYGTKKLTFAINPKPSGIRSLSGVKGKKLKVSWKAISGIGGYQIQYAVSSKFKGAKLISVKKSAVSKTLAGLKKGKTYYVRIRTWKKVGSKTYYSAWSKAKKKKINN